MRDASFDHPDGSFRRRFMLHIYLLRFSFLFFQFLDDSAARYTNLFTSSNVNSPCFLINFSSLLVSFVPGSFVFNFKLQ